jgi:HSP20 family protein
MARLSLFQPWPAGEWGDVFGDLRREMDALFSRYGSSTFAGGRGVFPAVNLYETGDAYVLTAELPGVNPKDIDVSLERSTVTIRGERRVEQPTEKDANVHRLERQSGEFRRAFELPVEIDAEKVEAEHRNGVLMLRMPKAPQHRPRQIQVQGS